MEWQSAGLRPVWLQPAFSHCVCAAPSSQLATPRAAGTKGCPSRPHSWKPRSARSNEAATRQRSQAGSPEAAPPGEVAHPKAWPQRWACGRWWAWPGSFCPRPFAAARCRRLTPEKTSASQSSAVRPFIRIHRPGLGFGANGQPRRAQPLPKGPRDPTSPPRTPGGCISPAAAAQSLLVMAHRTGSPPPPRPPRNRKLPSEPDFRNTRQQNSAAGLGGRRGSERVRGACSALWRREAGGASQPLISTWRGGRCHPLLQVRLTLESDVPKDRQTGRVASDANPYVLEL